MGNYLIQATEIRIGKLVFHWDNRRVKMSTLDKQRNVICVPRDIHALHISVDQSPRSPYDVQRPMILY